MDVKQDHQRWTYIRENRNYDEDELNEMGRNGWILCSWSENAITGEKLLAVWRRPDTQINTGDRT